MTHSLQWFFRIFSLSCLVASCSPRPTATSVSITPSVGAPTATATTQPADLEIPILAEPPQLPPAVNPLTGLPVPEASLLDLPAALVSSSHFPPAARPQSGLSFAPFVFEIYITEGATRFLTAFYGEFPKPDYSPTGSC